MDVRDTGTRRIRAITVGLVAAAVAGSLGVAALARAATEAPPGSTTSGTTDNGSTTDSGPPLTRGGNGAPHAHSGGS